MTFLDFPALETVAVVGQSHGLCVPSLEQMLRCSHKYWSRVLQAEAVPEVVPRFAYFDPFDDDTLVNPPLCFPFWVKPLHAYRSHLGFRVGSASQFRQVVATIRQHIMRLAEPLGYFLSQAKLPDSIARLNAHACIAEGIIGGRQCTLEGYVHHGEVTVYGVVDSIRERNRVSFARYQYPSGLPKRVQARMIDMTRRIVTHIGLDNSPFNIECFWDRRSDRIWLLEINPRISLSHCELFRKVDGVSHQQVALDLALGRRPTMPHREGEFKIAGKFFIRSHHNGRVKRVPSHAELECITRLVPGTSVQLLVSEGTDLANLQDQDSYSYELAWIWLGARDQYELIAKYHKVAKLMHLEWHQGSGERVAV